MDFEQFVKEVEITATQKEQPSCSCCGVTCSAALGIIIALLIIFFIF